MSASVTEDMIVSTTAGRVQGDRVGHCARWRGIPYATPPVGDLRYRSPQTAKKWRDVRSALAFGNVAPQPPTKVIPLPPHLVQSEDCLSLNVWVPEAALTDGRPRPVMVWLHGGAYFIGFSAQPIYNGQALAEDGDVIVVTLNYRLGAFGFLDFREFLGSSAETNLGLRDILLALQWVRDNIAAFGGNPDNVTLFGESAGGGCVTTLMTMPAAKGLFHRAIAQSPPVTSVYGPSRAAIIAGAFLELAGVNPDRAATDLRKTDAHALASHTLELLNHVATTMPGSVAFAPVVDGDVVHEEPLVAFQAGRAHRVPLIIGTNKDEASLFKLMKSPLMPISKDSVERMFELVSDDNSAVDVTLTDISSVYRGYPRQKACMGISRDAGFRMPSIWAATAHSAFAPTWMYRFDQSPPLMKLMGLGAMHATELPYVFGTLPTKVGTKDLAFRLGGLTAARRTMDRMHEHWLSFARTGDPEASASRPWPQYRAKTRSTLIIDVTDTVVNDPDADVRRAWGDVPFGYK
jgi:para-nitrobenzyl esterase